jgi:hypothetical protein
MANKPRIVKDYEKLDENIQEQIKLMYPYGFAKHLIQYKNAEGKFVSALPFETDDRYYLVRMTLIEARQIIEDDDDYDASGELKESVKEEYEEKYGDMDYLTITEGVSNLFLNQRQMSIQADLTKGESSFCNLSGNSVVHFLETIINPVFGLRILCIATGLFDEPDIDKMKTRYFLSGSCYGHQSTLP